MYICQWLRRQSLTIYFKNVLECYSSTFVNRLQKLEAGAFDASNFHKWQSEMKQKDLEAQLLAIEERRLMGKISHEEAFLARTNVLAANQQLVQNMKKEVIFNSFFL